METFLQAWRVEIGLCLVALFVLVAISSRKAAAKRSLDRKNFLRISGFLPNEQRNGEIEGRLSRLLPHWHQLEALTRLKARSLEVFDWRFTSIREKELCMVRFVDKFTRFSGTTTDTDHSRTIFLFPCAHEWPPFVAFLKVDFRLPSLIKAVVGIADAAADVVNQGQLTLGIEDPIQLKKAPPDGAPATFQELYTENAQAIASAIEALSRHQSALQNCGTLGIYCRDGWLAIESIYCTPSNSPGSKYLVSGSAAWEALRDISRM